MPTGQPAHRNQCAVYRARAIAAQETDHVAEILGADPAAEIGLRHIGAIAWRIEHARQHRIDIDALLFQFRRQAFGQSHHHAFRGAVGAHPPLPLQRAQRAHVDDRTPSAGKHPGQHRTHRIAHRVHIDGEHLRPPGLVDFPGTRPHGEASGQVEQRIDRANLFETGARRRFIAEVDAYRPRLPRSRVGGKIQIEQHGFGAERARAAGNATPQRPVGARDHDSLAFECHASDSASAG